MPKIFPLLLGLFALANSPASAQPAAPVPAPTQAPASGSAEPDSIHHVFDIYRDGGKIGTTIIDIDKQADTTTVNLKTHISVVILFVEAYRYDSAETEIWKAGHFVSFQSTTDDHGTKRSITATADGDKLDLVVDGAKRELPNIILPASLWDDDFINRTELFDPDKGTILSVKVTDMGDAHLQLHGDEVTARHYRISGDYPRDIWMNGDLPIRIKILAPDHSTIVSSLRPQ